MAMCLDPEADRFDAVRSVPASRQVTSDFGKKVELDLTTHEREFALSFFPLGVTFDVPASLTWMTEYSAFYQHEPARTAFISRFQQEVWLGLQQYKVPVIVLLPTTPKEAVCQVFENVNTGGVKLSVFELVTATFAADDFRLRPDWDERAARIRKHHSLRDFDETAFLTSITLLASYERSLSEGSPVSCKRKDVLQLKLDDYLGYADLIEDGLIRAAKFLTREKVFDSGSLPYGTQLIPLSAICAFLGDDFEKDAVRKKLARWYWCGVFGELYGGANETRYAFDLPEVVRWINGGDEPRSVRDATFSPTRLLTLQSRQSAAYKGLMALLMQVGSKDFLSGDPIELTTYFEQAVDIHHIFPRAYCESQGYPRLKWNSIANKSALAAKTNRIIGGNAPSVYLRKLDKEDNVGVEPLDQILTSHLIDPALLRGNVFGDFIRDRASGLITLIEKATGKRVSGKDSEEVVQAFGGVLLGATEAEHVAPASGESGPDGGVEDAGEVSDPLAALSALS